MDCRHAVLTLIVCNVAAIFLLLWIRRDQVASIAAQRDASQIRPRMPELRRLLDDQHGATAIEYGLICALIVIVMVVGLTSLANTTISMWGNVSNNVLAVSPS